MFLGNRTWVDLRNGLTSEGLNLEMGNHRREAARREGEASTSAENSSGKSVGQKISDNTLSESSPPTLNDILPGAWQVQILQPTGFVEQMRQELFPNGTFRGEEITPMGVRAGGRTTDRI